MSEEVKSVPADYLMDEKEIKKFAHRLGRHSLFFRTLYDLTRIVFSERVPTACIKFNRQDGRPLGMWINPKMWAEMIDEERDWVIAHELCHVIFDHFNRYRDFMKNGRNREVWNVGADISLNEMLVRQFGIKRHLFKHPICLESCWLDTIWENENVPAGKSSDFYINKLVKEGRYKTKVIWVRGGPAAPHSDHDEWFEFDEELDEVFDLDEYVTQDQAKGFLDKLSEEQQKSLSSGSGAGNGDGGGRWSEIVAPKPPKKRKWEKVIKHFLRKSLEGDVGYFERWGESGGRFSHLNRGNVMLPTNRFMLGEKTAKRKVNVTLYLDASGSCHHLTERFYKAAETIPLDRFNLKLAFFDDIVVETSLKDRKIRKGMGTRFDIIENHCLKQEEYPDIVFVISDGYAGKFNCKFPKRWHWFLTPDGSPNAIPKGSQIHLLENFE